MRNDSKIMVSGNTIDQILQHSCSDESISQMSLSAVGMDKQLSLHVMRIELQDWNLRWSQIKDVKHVSVYWIVDNKFDQATYSLITPKYEGLVH